MHDTTNQRCIFRYGFREPSALPATDGNGAVPFANKPDVLIFQSQHQKKG
jgi:hypothetical protein